MTIKVAFFDCDGTLTKARNSWEYLHRKLNIWDKQAERYQALFREGKISYYEFCKNDALLWKGLPVSSVVSLLKDITYHSGAYEVVKALKKRGILTVILSTGLSLLVERVREDLGIDMSFSNELLSESGHLTGEIKINVGFNKKGYLVKKILGDIGVSRKEACAVGDGDGDTSMFEEVVLAIGFHPQDHVSSVIHRAICGRSLLEMVEIIDEYERHTSSVV